MSEQNPSDIHLAYLKAFNAGDIEATVACYESRGCYVSKSGRTAIGDAELREVYRVTFSNKPQMKFDIRKIIPAGGDLALVILGWTSKAVSAAGDAKVW
jgi:ketosteroid isomerase-like protein